jgi:hypothetical protein
MGFSSKTFAERFATMGEPAEEQFRLWAEQNGVTYVDFGLKKPPIKKFYQLSPLIRGMPDYICEGTAPFFVECKGCASRTLKIKLESIEVMTRWDHELPMWIFIYNSKKHAYAMINLRQLVDLCEGTRIKEFDGDHRQYYDIPIGRVEWTEIQESTNDRREESTIGY